jgi:uncharacterized membrane protein YczE
MKIKPQPPRSCLGWFAWVFGILLVLFAISYTIDMIRLTNAWNEAYALAAQLGYTPERHLADQTSNQLVNLLLVTAGCDVRVVFTTPLDPPDFASRLGQAVTPLVMAALRVAGTCTYNFPLLLMAAIRSGSLETRLIDCRQYMNTDGSSWMRTTRSR